ncbi:LysR family transcriptional regulator [Clostridium sardiniense]|uniref:LysR family transcriptional regulator n=1 Tax=Clostridium sardiniense TaxID=29369 RepID=UPI00195BE3F9|nr:LysR family transcriptional regulator [Clostridium sardiniense]MBM7835583.1 DNA-binding transcriptional LysR family regulator [Clostridium sardiniense]
MNFSDLEYFNYLCKVKSFTKVAEDLFVSQPSVSMSVAKLEKELGVKLISRNLAKKELTITKAGEILRVGSENIINEIENIKFEINKLNARKIKFGIPPIIRLSYLENLINYTILNEIDIIQLSSEKLLDKILTGDIDMAILCLLTELKVADFDFNYLSEEKFVLCLNKVRYCYDDNFKWDDLESETWIILEFAYIHKMIFQKICSKYNINPKNVIYVQDIETASSFLEMGIGISIFSEELANNIVNSSEKLKKIDLPVENINIYLVTKNSKYLSIKERKIKEFIIKNFYNKNKSSN